MKEKITYKQLCDTSFRRKEQMKVKTEAVWVAFLELRELISITGFTEKYFQRTHGWFSQRLNGNIVNNKVCEFSTDECNKIASSFRDLAKRLNEYADAIEKAI